MLIKINNGIPVIHPITNENFFQLFPEVTFPPILTPDVVTPFGFGMYEFTHQPSLGTYEKAVEVAPVCSEPGIWMQTWEVVPMTSEEIEQKNERLKQGNKNKASYFLGATDWTQQPDVDNPANPPWLANKADFTSYRAQIRAIAVNPPIAVNEWPVKPEEVWVGGDITQMGEAVVSGTV